MKRQGATATGWTPKEKGLKQKAFAHFQYRPLSFSVYPPVSAQPFGFKKRSLCAGSAAAMPRTILP
jgi:hypothetical protein